MASVLVVLLFRWVNPPTTYLIFSERLRLGSVSRQWVPISAMADALPLSAAAAEDANFCRHAGFDFDGIEAAWRDQHRLRGGSTISQQTAKNLFLWSGRSWIRKGLEAWYTLLMELMWPKARILEVYANIIEYGDGVYGAQAASRHFFGKDAARLGPEEASRLAAVLPSPRKYSVSKPGPYVQRRSRAIQRQMRALGGPGYLDFD